MADQRLLATIISISLGVTAAAQFSERPHLVGSGEQGVDASGRSIKSPRIRAVHTTDPSLFGGTAYLFERDPFLAYQLGRNLNFREFRDRDGVFSPTISGLGGPMPDGTTAKITTNNQVSCVGCHNLPSGNPGGGANFSKDSGRGRNSPHYYGAGIVEMLALQIRRDILSQFDRNGDGWLSAVEALAAGDHCYVSTGTVSVDFGRPALSNHTTGTPGFNNIVRVWYVDRQGRHVQGATEVDGVRTFGYNFHIVVWGHGQGVGRTALNPTNRAFLWDPFVAHGGLEADDPTTFDDPERDGVSVRTLAGAEQFPATHRPPDAGRRRDRLGFSHDDPDGDGYLTEISEGDLDLGEWFMLNAPRPAFAGTAAEYADGLATMQSMGCTECHVADWLIRPRDAEFAGDRRLFDLDVRWNDAARRLEGELVRLYDVRGDRYVRRFEGFTVRGLFSDLRHHDMGAGFAEVDFGGQVNTVWRTPPLWGVGTSFPWGHDGASLTLEHAIERHDGEGSAAKAAWLAATPAERQRLLSFLHKLVLYDIESLPADVDGDGTISAHFTVAGEDTGPERFNAEWLFRVPLRIQGRVVTATGPITSFAGTNIEDAYGLDLPLRRDTDRDGWPDVWDRAPGHPGYHDGVR